METVAKLGPSPGAAEVRHSLPGREERFRSYNKWLQEKFGERVYKVIVDAGFTCPNRDGTVAVGGCAYCNNNSFRPPSAIKTDPIRDQVREGIEYIRKRFEAHKFIIYFQPFSNTYAETGYLRRLYTDAIDHPDVVGLAIGTRPDCVDEEKIRMIHEFVERLDPNIVIERMFGEAPFGLLVAPTWRRNKNDLVRDIKRIFEERNVRQGAKRN